MMAIARAQRPSRPVFPVSRGPVAVARAKALQNQRQPLQRCVRCVLLAVVLLVPTVIGLTGGITGGEPDAQAIRSSLETMHEEWAEQQRNRRAAAAPRTAIQLPKVDLGFEASLNLRITDVRKRSCRPATGEQLGFVCVADISASIAGHPPVERRIQGRFVSGWSQWVARDVKPVEIN